MPIDWLYGLIGGLMIGSAAAIFLLLNGRIMGASGLLGGVVDGSQSGVTRRTSLVFLAGLIGAPAFYHLAFGAAATHLTSNASILITAGLCVGFGTRLANGCTSGHGVCGISRLSVRGLSATAFYLLAGAATVAVARQIWGII